MSSPLAALYPPRRWATNAAPVAVLLAIMALLAGAAAASADEREVFGLSVQGRPLVSVAEAAPEADLTVLVVGAIHGNETAGIRTARQLIAAPAPRRTELVVVPTINPDGVAADTRGNARGVDLNRNFAYDWRPLSGGEYSGTGPLSEPESRAASRLIRGVRPDLTIWFHQPFGIVDRPPQGVFLARRYAHLVGLPMVRLRGAYPGAATRWQNHAYPASTAFVVELPALVSAGLAGRAAGAVRALAAELAGADVGAGRKAPRAAP